MRIVSKLFNRQRVTIGVVVGLILCMFVAPLQTGAASYAPLLYPPKRPVCANKPIKSVKTRHKVVAMTFDDGPWPVNTDKILDSLSMYGARSTFFMVSNNARRYPDIAKRVLKRGHEIANHSKTHGTYSSSKIAREIGYANWDIRVVTGTIPWLFRAPGLTRGSAIDARMSYYNMCNIFTDADLGDWRSPRVSAYTICQRFKRALHPGYINLVHDGGSHAQTVKAVPCMLAHAKRQGYKFVTVSQLLNMGTPLYY